MTSAPIRITVNDRLHELLPGHDFEAGTTLAALLREKLGLTGLKVACDEGACGACTVIMDGKAVLSCMVLAVEADGHEILTIEGLPEDDPVIEAFARAVRAGLRHGAAVRLLHARLRDGRPGAARTRTPGPRSTEVKEALSGNICRCGCYAGIAQAVLHASEKLAAARRRAMKTPLPAARRRASTSAATGPRIDGLREGQRQSRCTPTTWPPSSRFPDLLYAKVLRSPYAHARITQPRRPRGRGAARRGRHPHLRRPRGRRAQADQRRLDRRRRHASPTSAWMWRRFRDRRVLGDYACWVGDEVGAVVAAESEAIAEEALRLIEVDWEVLPFVLDAEEAMKPGAPRAPSRDRPRQRAARGAESADRRSSSTRATSRRLRRAPSGRRGHLGPPQRHAGLPRQLVLRRRVARRPAHRLVQLLRGRPDPHAHQPDARPAAPQGARDQPLRRRPVRPRRHRRPAVLPLHRAAGQEDRPAGQVQAHAARELPRRPPAGHLHGQRRRRERTAPSPPWTSRPSATPGPTPTTPCSR